MSLSQRKTRDAKTPAGQRDDDGLQWITLVQTSGKDVRFRGTYIAEATSYRASVPIWHVIHLYRRCASGCVSYVVSIRTHQNTVGVEETIRVVRAASIEAVMDFLEQYSPEKEVQSSLPASELKRLGPVQAALHTAKMRRDISQVRRHYDAMVGDFLFNIGSLKLS